MAPGYILVKAAIKAKISIGLRDWVGIEGESVLHSLDKKMATMLSELLKEYSPTEKRHICYLFKDICTIPIVYIVHKCFMAPFLLWTLQLIDWIILEANAVKIIWNAYQVWKVGIVLSLEYFSSYKGWKRDQLFIKRLTRGGRQEVESVWWSLQMFTLSEEAVWALGCSLVEPIQILL